MGSASSKGRETRARVVLELGDLPHNLVPHVYGSSSPIDSSPSALDSSNLLAMEARGASWELSFALPSTCGGVYYKFVLVAQEPSTDAVVAEECPYRILNPLESSQIKSQAVFKLPDSKLCKATVTIFSSLTSEADHLESPSSTAYLAGKAESPRERKSSKKHILEVFSNRCVSIKDLVLLGCETQVNASVVGELGAEASVHQSSCLNESAVAKEEPETPRFEDHQGLFVERTSPKLIRNCSDVSLISGGRVLDDEPEDMPEAAGAVAAAAVSERMLLPKERRQLAIVLVGLPARGKTFTAVKLTRYLRWLGHDTKHFNVGKYRRLKHGSTQSADFFRGDNQEGVDARNEVAVLAMEDMLSWMEEGGQIGVFDATNTTKERRSMILRMAEGKCKVIFLETICNDRSIIDRNIVLKIQQSPDYAGQTDMKAALEDFKARLANYEKVYEPVDQGSYIKMIDTVTGEGGQIEVNGISGYLPGRIVFFLVNTHITPRPIFLTRHGESTYNLTGQIGGDPGLSTAGEAYALKLTEFINKQLKHESTASIWTSTLQRTILTARHVIRFPKVQWRALDEINAGICDGMTYEEIKDKMPDEYAARKADKLRYRYPRGESYLDVIQRLEPVIIELERQRAPVVVIAHQAVLRSLYAYFADKPLKEIPHIEFPLHTIIEIQMGVTGIQEQRHRLI